MRFKPWVRGTLAMVMGTMLGVAATPLAAKVTAEEAAKLGGPELTCFGAEKKGTADGIPAYSGKWVGKWPGVSKPYGYEPGPYADEKPMITITAANMAAHTDELTEGQKALLKRYANFRMLVYPSHRDFGYPDWTCDVARKNAVQAELGEKGLEVHALGGATAFSFYKSGIEAIWAMKTTYRPWTEKAVLDIANVYGNGTIGWGRNKFISLNAMNDPAANPRPALTERINTYFYSGYLLPERDKGMVAVGFQPNSYLKDATQAWQYLPGTRRVRQAPEIGYDYPTPPAGAHTTDEEAGFNGSPERYTWKLVGKKAVYVPYNNFRINDPAIRYKDLITPNSINPDYVRYELHRAIVVEGELIGGFRHIYKKRRLFIDEDSLQTLWAEHYDGRGELWRIAMITYFYSQEASAYARGVQVFHDLGAGVYEATSLVNERGDDWWRLNTPMKPTMFGPEAAARAGH